MFSKLHADFVQLSGQSCPGCQGGWLTMTYLEPIATYPKLDLNPQLLGSDMLAMLIEAQAS